MTGQPPSRGFPEAEYLRRTEAAQEMMADSGIACLLVCTEPEVRYFTGFFTPFWQSPTRPWFVVVPPAGKPIAVIPSIGESAMSGTWVEDIRTWSAPQPDDDGVSLLAETIREVVGPSGRVGLPMGHETHLRMPLNDFATLQKQLRDIAFVDATEIVRSQRMVKSEAEIAKVAHICTTVSDAFEALPGMLHVGMSEREAFAAFKVDLLQRGADDVPYLVGATGPGFSNVIKQPGDRVIEHGDLLMFDTGSVFDGYSSDFDRYYAFGEADSAASGAYRTVWEATEAGLEAMRPGATTSDVWAAMANVLTTGGSLGNSVGRLGHGLGMQVTEWPSNTADDGTEIVEGMVLTLEPGLTWEPGKLMLHEENVAIRSDGPELLSRRAPPELPVIT
ncbi:MAG: Xaa-Pro peptidase family protein [Acidimicrobiales bacterium]|nr:Xaa-Pro peptidase family protein [Acidimicrobiales bacterium]